eukprot:g3753.t1 g3753   contig13:80462-81778(+)
MADDDTGPCKPDRSKLKRKVVQSLIDHTYYNYSLVNVDEELARRSSQRQYKNPKRKGLTTNFPAKLHKILSKPEFRHIIRWMDHTKLMGRLVNPGKRIPDKQGEPNFWNIAKDFPLPPNPYDDESTGNGSDYEEHDEFLKVCIQSTCNRWEQETVGS